MAKYYGKIRLKSGGHPINVSVEASTNSAATKAIEAQYAGQIQSWAKQMSTTPN
ncbi:hypothetical protein [Flavobacterium aciduliphilum]|uniref:Uncharacterized protein n=1 Tax=Flavobacterium aciduliphilum TaxID=1101402 RepID=A0A328YT56_9FLAO|nr:hypothetical protein [Flavobacterium aciduliphilum]RAR73717.1 hypothetical protein CLV55_10336 [Flavobacterium aciduliphilum]